MLEDASSASPRPGAVLLLVPSTSYRAGDFLAAACALGVRVVVGSDHRQVLAHYAAEHSVQVALHDPWRGVAQIAAHAARVPLAAILGTDDESALLAARAARALGLAHNAPDAVAAARDKYRLRCALRDAGVPGPGFRLVELPDGPARAAPELRYPCVVKPRSLSASRGVIRADNAAAFLAACRRSAAILAGAGHLAESAQRNTLLVEDYLPGVEIAIEALLDDGRLHVLALLDKPDPMPGPFFEETLLVTPSRLPRRVQHAAIDALAAAARALGLRHGPLHAELRITDAGARIVEIAPRSIGGLCSRALRFAAGDSLEVLILRQALGLPVRTRAADGASGVLMLPVPGAGRLRRVDGLHAARQVPGIEDVVIGIVPGEPLVPLPEGGRYPGFVFARGDTPRQVEHALRTAHGCLRWHLDPEPTRQPPRDGE